MQKILNKLNKVMYAINKRKESLFIILLLIFSLISRLINISSHTFPFGFDHGKDSLSILLFIKTLKPPLIGPWTSIPGLFFGPGWYYLLAPGSLLSGNDPISGVYTMIFLNLITIYLAYKYFGKLEATFVATASAWTMLSTSAWNPFPMPLLALIILIILKISKLKQKHLLLLGIITSLQFHFSSAYAVFSSIGVFSILTIYFFQKKLIINIKKIGIFIIGLAIPFIPQLLFEFRHGFIETKSILNYFSVQSNDKIRANISDIIIVTIKEFRTIFLPNIHNPILNNFILFIIISLIIWGGYKIYSQNLTLLYKKELLFFVVIPILGFSFTHFNIWYVYATFPIILIFIVQFIKKLSPKIQNVIILSLIILQIFNLYHFITIDKNKLLINKSFYRAKLKAIQTIRNDSKGEPFSSYQYESDIYDFPYQYIYIWQGMMGQKLPIEFSYQPEKKDYIPGKQTLIKNLPIFKRNNPKYIYYIVEKPQYPDLLKDWWNQQNYEKIIKEIKITPDLTVYKALPKTST